MERDHIVSILRQSPSPAYVVHLGQLEKNLKILQEVQEQSGATILLALKGFAMFGVFPLVRQYLSGICASGPQEARLGAEEFGGQVHTFAPAFSQADLEECLKHSHHIVFNSFSQWRKFRPLINQSGKPVSVGLRVNPEVSTGAVALYDPCAPNSRLGILRSEFDGQSMEGIEGLHFHTLCEQNSDALEATLEGFERKFGEFLPGLKWVNFGGGHHITREDYDRDLLVRLIRHFRETYDLKVFLEPGEAVALNTGLLVTEVMDILPRKKHIAILDTSVTAHMPDVLEMPYRPGIIDGFEPGEKAYTYQLGGMTCLAGDVIGDWSFEVPLKPGDRLAFTDMAHYTMVKNTTFNGIKLPDIAVYDPQSDSLEVLRKFGYEDYRNRLG
ncbi:carboxynorspermidine decarboxylase [Puniceicoccales bacterium CK1056]|uniref:Carboxynorspermidine/carboxyspermidine decarboxylase n=1 Tax=Oceanipulchritudo coccoides TaxID=2706888 RepID=A0A6B2M1C9_9BACT|nr:carboxynorspermidine decarboxylase [Oceanipulchritudo coccoides]NDV62728.1 carboxynorspermidine decarboxylase [Oceanipulchritudo coccoides]